MTTSPESEIRVTTRLDLEATIFIEIIASSDHSHGSVIMCNSLDLSQSGLQVLVDEDVAVGSIFRLCVDLPQGAPVFLVGEVMWKRADDKESAWRLGFSLFESDETDIVRWKEVVASLAVN